MKAAKSLKLFSINFLYYFLLFNVSLSIYSHNLITEKEK